MDATLVGSGLLLGDTIINNKDQPNDEKSQCISAKNIYDNTFLNSRFFERQTVSAHSNQMNHFLNRPESGRTSQPTQSLTGEMRMNNEFTHNNMVPFFGSKVRQNVDENASTSKLETFTGVYQNSKNKEEISPMFSLKKDNIFGNESKTDTLKERYNPSRYHQNIPLTEPIHVGPGLNQGYTSKPSGGFQQADALQYAQRPNVDELRTKNNPKITYEGRVVNGFIGSRRGVEPNVAQNRVIRFHEYENVPRMNTTVVHAGERSEENFIDKETNRQNTLFSYSAPAGPTIASKPASHNEYRNRTSHRQNLDTDGVRNATASYRPRLNIKYCSEKMPEDPKENSYMGSVKSAVQQIMAPIQDALKTTIKETNIHDTREAGNFATAVKKSTVYDPNDTTRTTIKETLIDNSRVGEFGPIDKRGAVYDPNDIAKTTIKQTSIHDTRLGQMKRISQNSHAVLPEPAKTTARETLKQYVEYSNMNGPKSMTQHNQDQLKTTVKETIHEDNHMGVPHMSKDTGYITNPKCAPPTNKQFTSDNEYSGQAQAQTNQKGGYTVSNMEAPNTTRQTTSDIFYSGTADGLNKPKSYQDIYNATLNDIKENIAIGRAPTQIGVKVAPDTTQIGNVEIRPGLENVTVVSSTPIQNTLADPSSMHIDKDMNCTSERQNDRNDPAQLTPFKDNPFTKPLNSTA
tara:strand:- start:16898 stop:18958 length:2061 start_codon:yes stop_codon:yes gene_type:complete